MNLSLRELKWGIRWSCCFKNMEQSIAIFVNNAFKIVQQSAKDKEDTCRRADARQRYLTQDFTP